MNPHLQKLVDRYPPLLGCHECIQQAFEVLQNCFAEGNKLLVCGNGGSADAEHMVGELMKGFTLPRRLTRQQTLPFEQAMGAEGTALAAKLEGALPAISLVSQSSLLSAIVNDGAPNLVYAQQVFGYGVAGDVLFAISTSGKSRSVQRALQTAKVLGLKTIGLTGQSGGTMAAWCDVSIRCPSSDTPQIQEFHLPIYHTLCIMLETAFFAA